MDYNIQENAQYRVIKETQNKTTIICHSLEWP